AAHGGQVNGKLNGKLSGKNAFRSIGEPNRPLKGALSGPRADQRPPRETRSISAFTMRSTSPGRLSSSQDFSIGRSISLTRSSRVRALLLSTVLARLLKAVSWG